MNKLITLIAAVVLAGAFTMNAAAQDKVTASATLPAADGTLAAGEYQYVKTFRQTTVGVSYGTDGRVHIALATNGQVWTAIGVGSLRMDGSTMYIGSLTKTGPVISTELGKGHGHQKIADDPDLTGIYKAADGRSVIEFSLPAAKAAPGGALKFIYACGFNQDTRGLHRERGALNLSLVQP